MRLRLTVTFALVVTLAVPAAGQAPRRLTPAQQEQLRKLIAASPDGKLSAQQRQKLRQQFLERAARTEAKPVESVKKVSPPAPPPAAKPLGDTEVAAAIDRHIDAKLAEEGLAKSPPATDAEFLRRVTLDLTGVVPTAKEVRAFLADADPEKRTKLVDRLLESPNFGRRQSDVWVAKLIPRESDNRFVKPEPFQEWIAAEFNANRPWNEFVIKMLTATGSPEENPAVTLFMANRSADKLTDLVGTQLMGVQIACAQCHNHPFTGWKQDDYWGMAAFFSKVSPKPPGNPRRAEGEKPFPGSVTELATETRFKDFFPESAKKLAPKLPGSVAPTLDQAGPYRPTLAKWLTSGSTPYFSQAFVNRAWAQMYGRGLVDPVDDLDPSHPASHPELFDELAAQFRATGFNVKRLYRTLALTEAYARSGTPTAGNEADATYYSHMNVKVLSPEQLFDSIAQVVPTINGAPVAARNKAALLPRRPAVRDQFVQFFLAGADAPNAKEYEAGIPQALRLMNSKILSNPRVAEPFADFTFDRVCDNMYLATLSRLPTDAERVELRKYHTQNGGTLAVKADILWALLNCSEFALNR